MHITDTYAACDLCPRGCGVNRLSGGKGYCGETAELRIAAAGIHRGEEPPITGGGGSGTIFVSGCNLGCGFCQNWQISRAGMGRMVTEGEFARICMTLQEQGAENINIVTGSHAVPALALGIKAARAQGLTLPVLWNSSAYESLTALDLLRDIAEVYLPDLKTLDPALSARFFKAPDYPERAAAAIRRMMDFRELRFGPPRTIGPDEAGSPRVLRSGVLIRHLVLPGYLGATRQVLRWYADNAQGWALFSLMTQYTPPNPTEADIPGRAISEAEYETLLRWLEEFEIEDGFYQELVPGNTDWLPNFEKPNPFSSELSQPTWHWKQPVQRPS
ncbi:radical SAM protein [Treponema sp. TIM-1]|uniref:radical SAM protein n=1 Tax=Treponema sp. TIM-1 TaxID=2898417 RepID=UPI00398061F4